jgi:hypothetical protein
VCSRDAGNNGEDQRVGDNRFSHSYGNFET